MLNLKEYKEYIAKQDFPEASKKALLQTVMPCFDFADYIAAKYNETVDDGQVRIDALLLSKRAEINKGSEEFSKLNYHDYTELTSTRLAKVISEYAKEEGYQDWKKLGDSLKKLLRISIKEMCDKA